MIDKHPQQPPETQPDHNSDPLPESQLPRLRRDIPAEDFLSSPPPVPRMESPFDLRLANPGPTSPDADQVAEWMSRPHLLETWEQPWPAERWRQDWIAKSSTTYARAAILSYSTAASPLTNTTRDTTKGATPAAPASPSKADRSVPVGYVEIYRPHRDEIGATYRSQPHDLGLHIAIGEPALTGQGIFSHFLGQLTTALFKADPQCQLILGEPDYRNTRAHRALVKASFSDFGERQQRADRRVRLFGLLRPGVGCIPQQRLETTT